MGILFIALLKYLFKARIAAVDIDNTKLSIAERFGADIIINSGSENILNIKEKISGFSDPGFDAAILTYTIQDTVDMAMAAVRDGGHIQVFAGPSKEKQISVDFEYLYKNEIMLFSSYSASPDSCRKSFELLKDGKIDYTPLISDILSVEDFKKGLNKALSKKYFKIVFYFDDIFK
jgi:threonine dehydrogenase-like Zn-dependent dehydrogenase